METESENYTECRVTVRFEDIRNSDEFYYEYIYNMVGKGVITGYADGTFRPYANCSRAPVVTFLWRLKRSPEPEKVAEFRNLTGNTDFDKAISWATENGIITGWEEDNKFRPWRDCSRLAIVSFIARYDGLQN